MCAFDVVLVHGETNVKDWNERLPFGLPLHWIAPHFNASRVLYCDHELGGSPPCRGLVGWLVGRHVPLGSSTAPFGSVNKKPSAAEPLARIAARPAAIRHGRGAQ